MDITRTSIVMMALLAIARPAIADEDIAERVAKVTDGYTVFETKSVKLQNVKPVTFPAARGDCFVFVLRPDAGGVVAASAIGNIAVDLKEPGRGYSLDPDVAADGGVTRSYCPLVDGTVRLGVYQFVVDKRHPSGFRNTKLGKGSMKVEIWRKRGATKEVAKEEAARKAQAERTRKWDQINADQRMLACPDCRKDRASCLRGAYPASVWKGEGLTCEQGFERCLRNRGSSVKACPR